MELTKAIELNEESEKSLRKHKFVDHADAVKMGNVAIKRVQARRASSLPDAHILLHGETRAGEK